MPFPDINDTRGGGRRFSYEPSKRSLSDDEIIAKFKDLIESPNDLHKPSARNILSSNNLLRMREILQKRGFPIEHSEAETVTRKPKTFDDWKLVFKEIGLPIPPDMNQLNYMLKNYPDRFKGIRIEGEETTNKTGEKSFIPTLSKVILPAKEYASDMENKKLSPIQELSGISDRHGLAPLHAQSNAPERARSVNPGRQRPHSPGNIAGDIATLGRANISRYPIEPEQFAPLKTERDVEWDNMIQAEAINRQAEEQNKKRAEDRSKISMPTASDPDYIQFRRMNPALAAFQTNAFTTLQHALEKSKPHVPAKPGLVEPVELERQANFLMHELHPDTPENVDQYQALTNILGRHAQSDAVAEAAEPYLNELSKNPALRHKELMGDVERDFNRNILDESTREFNEKILPGIRDKYQTPGLRMHGHQGKNAEEAARRHGEGVASALAKAGIGMRGTTLNAANAHAGNLAHAAGINQKAAAEDRTHNTEATKMLAEAQNKRTMNKAAWMTDARNVGQAQRLQLQKERDIANAQQKDIENHGLNNAMIAAKLAQGLPADQAISGVEKLQTPMPETTKGNTWSALGDMAMSAAGKRMPQNAKRGGRIHKAIGGQVNPMQDVIQNAVIDKIDPVTELRRMLQHTQGVQGLQARQQLKIGGMVDPIKAGAEDAHMYAGHNAMKDKLHRLRNPEKKPFMTDLLESMASGAQDAPGWLGRSMKAFNHGSGLRNKEHEANRDNLSEADELEYKLQQKLEEKAMKEREAAQKDRDLARQDQLAASTIEHQRMMNQKLGHEIGGGFAPEHEDDRPTGKQTATEATNVKVAKERAENVAEMLENARKIKALINGTPGDEKAGIKEVPGLKTGYWKNTAHGWFGPALSGDDPDRYRELENLFDEHLVLTNRDKELSGKTGSRQTNMGLQLQKDAKFSKELDRETILKKLDHIEKTAPRVLEGLVKTIQSHKGSKNAQKYPLQFIPSVSEPVAPGGKNSNKSFATLTPQEVSKLSSYELQQYRANIASMMKG